jgi:hypothetical protein
MTSLDKDSSSAKPNQTLYQTNFKGFVKKTICKFDKRFPGQLRDYRAMSLEEKQREQERVLDLLARLGIGDGAGPRSGCNTLPCQSKRATSDSHSPSVRRRSFDDTMSPLLSHEDGQGHSGGASFSIMVDESPITKIFSQTNRNETPEKDKSELLLSPKSSPIGSHPSPQRSGPSSPPTDFPVDMSSDSVELVRAEKSVSSHSNCFDSPDRLRPNPHKRMASSSARRGENLVRHKYNEGFSPPPDNAERYLEVALSSRMERMSISPTSSSGPKDFFVTSQSPISPQLSYESSEDDNSSNDGRGRISLEHRTELRRSDDTIGTFDTGRSRLEYGNAERRRALKEVPVNVGLKHGATFHLQKLEVKRAERRRLDVSRKIQGMSRKRLVRFPDPLARYDSKQRKALNDILQWIHQSEPENLPMGSVLFSLSQEHIVDLCLKLLLNDDAVTAKCPKTPSDLQGQTLVVARTKEDIGKWESALREGTGCSVFNHATLPLSERIRTSTAEKATMYDVVLTTFDAMKSPDTAISVNESGHAILSKVGNDQGWYSRRSASQSDAGPQKCMKLSVLHKVNFKRIVFVDLLGRKSFLAKEGSARASAAVALSGDSRYVRENPVLAHNIHVFIKTNSSCLC